MSLATLERVQHKQVGTRVIKAGMKLYCDVQSYGFTYGRYYRIYEIKDGYITVKDNDGIVVIFSSVTDLKNIFMIIYE